MNNYYILKLDWHDESKEWFQQEPEQFIVCDSAEKALRVGYNIAYGCEESETFNNPHNIYLFETDNTGLFTEDDGFLCAWFDCNTYVKH